MGFEVVVVGAGNAALCAAIAAAGQGAKVLVLERAPGTKRGGNSWFSDGAIRFAHDGLDTVRTLVPDMTDDEAARIDLPPYPAQRYFEDLTALSDGRCDPVLARVLSSRSLRTMEWLRDQGIPFAMIYDNQAFEVAGRHHFWGNLSVRVDGKGIGLVERLMSRAADLGIEVWYEARAINLEEAEDGLLVEVQRADGTELVAAPAVVLACGGFEASATERRTHLGDEWGEAVVRGTACNTGDGLRMALEMGAVQYGDWAGCHAVATDANAPRTGDFTKPGDIFKKHSYPLGIIVNRMGERFVDEGADFRNYTYAQYGREVLRQPGGIAYQIFDAQAVGKVRAEYRLPEATREVAASIDELAEKIDIDRTAFLQTVARYNDAVQDGDYNPEILDGKGTVGIEPAKSNWALRIEQPPFFAFPVTCGITFTFGGIQVNDRAEVMRADGDPIPGLYAAGEMVGGLFFGNYPGGAGLMSGATFGRIAGVGATMRAHRSPK